MQQRYGYHWLRFQRLRSWKCVSGMLEEQSSDKSRRLLSRRLWQKLTSKPMLSGLHNSPPLPSRCLFECLIQITKADSLSRSPSVHEKEKFEKESLRGLEICLRVHTTRKDPGFMPPWLQTGKHVLEVDGVKSGEAE